MILIPKHYPIEGVHLLFDGCVKCKVPVTDQLLQHYADSPCTYLIIHEGYIYGRFIYKVDEMSMAMDSEINDICEMHQFVHIVSQRRITQRNNRSYFRMYVNRKKIKSADDFCSVLMNIGFDVNLDKAEPTTTFQMSLDISSDFFEGRTEGKMAMNL